ncbi:hypothetical protein ACFL3T_02105 [Patescibacteria group bacterium]
MRNANQPDNLEQVQAPTPAMDNVAMQHIKNHEYESAYAPLSRAEYADTQWNNLSKGIDNASLPEDPNRKEPLSPEEYEAAQKEQIKEDADNFGAEASPEMEMNNESIVLIEEVNVLIEKLLEEVAAAREQIGKLKENASTTTLFPIIGGISKIFKQRKYKKIMARVKEAQAKLQDKTGELQQRIEIDNLSPDLSNKSMTTSGIADIGELASAVGSLSNCAMIFGGVSGLFDIIGTDNAFKNHEKLIRTDVKLEDIEGQLQNAQVGNTESLAKLKVRRDYYRDGVIENAQRLAA